MTSPYRIERDRGIKEYRQQRPSTPSVYGSDQPITTAISSVPAVGESGVAAENHGAGDAGALRRPFSAVSVRNSVVGALTSTSHHSALSWLSVGANSLTTKYCDTKQATLSERRIVAMSQVQLFLRFLRRRHEYRDTSRRRFRSRIVAMSQVQLFLSAVSSEFRSYRDALGAGLERPNVTVKAQEEFIPTGTETLDKLDLYIRDCNAVVHLIGDRTGAWAEAPTLQTLRARYPDLAERLSVLKSSLETGEPPLSYTQWEAYLAVYHRKTLLIAVAQPGAARDDTLAIDPQLRAAQHAHLERLRQLGRHPEITFTDKTDLIAEVLRSAVLELLVKAETLRLNEPTITIQIGGLDLRTRADPGKSEQERLDADLVVTVPVTISNEAEPSRTLFLESTRVTLNLCGKAEIFKWAYFVKMNEEVYDYWLGIQSDAARIAIRAGSTEHREILHVPSSQLSWATFIKCFGSDNSSIKKQS